MRLSHIVGHFGRDYHRYFHKTTHYTVFTPGCLIDNFVQTFFLDSICIGATGCQEFTYLGLRGGIVAIKHILTNEVAMTGKGLLGFLIHVQDSTFGIAHRYGTIHFITPRIHSSYYLSASRFC